MSALLLAARLLLSAVFALAGLSKLTGRDALRETLAEFGLPLRASVAGAIILAPVELGVAALLVPATTARWAAVGALVLLVAFCAAIARALVRGERPDCGCFGRRSTPIGKGTLARNGALAAAAVFVVAAGPGESVGDAFAGVDVSPLVIALAVVAAVVVVQGWFSWELFKQHGRLLARIRTLEEGTTPAQPEGLPVGAEAPPLELLDERLAPELPLALVFSNTGCGACETLAPELERLREERDGELEILLVEDDREALAAYRIFTVPSATVVDAAGHIAAATAVGATAVEKLLASRGRRSERLRVATA